MKRIRLLITSLFTVLLLLVLLIFHISIVRSAGIIAFVYYIAVYWILGFDIAVDGLFTVLLFPSVSVAIITSSVLVYVPVLLKSFSLPPLPEPVMYLIFLIPVLLTGYILTTVMNIFNVSRYKKIPLLQAAQTVLYIFSLIDGYLFFNLLQRYVNLPVILITVFYTSASVYLYFMICWAVKMSLREIFFYTFIGILVFSQIIIALSFFPLGPYMLPLAGTVCLYIFNGVLLSSYKRTPLRRSLLEYLFIGVVVIILIFTTTTWGSVGYIWSF